MPEQFQRVRTWLNRRMSTWLSMLVLAAMSANIVWAHPHIWVDVRMVLQFDETGALNEIRHIWRFDEAFSSWAIQGLDVNEDGEVSSAEMAELAADYVDGLGEYDFFTFAGTGDIDFELVSADTPVMHWQDGRVAIEFALALQQPQASIGDIEIAVMDPEWYVALELVDDGPVALENAPATCVTSIVPPVQVSQEVEQRLLSLGPDVTQLPSDLRAALREAGQRVRVSCDGTAGGQTAAQAVEQVATGPRSAPFAAPPAEVGLPVPRSGFFGWVYAVQRQFYQSLTDALGDLKSDGNAFWILGTLSFLYGVFHAAGPGHGKVVISSYVLASERQVWRGVVMSFASAMVQALVAVLFVVVAAQVLGLTSMAMSDAATWMIAGSYALVVVLGLWLVTRKLFGWGHGHAHANHGEGHDHELEHGHHHVVTAEQTAGSWRDAAGVVLAVGLRPCSGALVVLVFALSQGVFAAGIASAFLMGLGTALTVSLLATMAMVLKEGSLRLAGGPGSKLAGQVIWWLELAGAFAVLGFGVILLLASF